MLPIRTLGCYVNIYSLAWYLVHLQPCLELGFHDWIAIIGHQDAIVVGILLAPAVWVHHGVVTDFSCNEVPNKRTYKHNKQTLGTC